MPSLDPDLPIPIYFQLKTLLFEEIVAGRYPPGSRLPTEHELCERYGISRTPVTRALRELAEDGVIIRRRRAGTFVNPLWRRPAGKIDSVRVVVTEEKWERSLAESAPPDIPVRIAPWIALPNLHRSLTRLVGEGQAPDIALIDSVWVTEFARLGFILPIDQIAREWVENDLLPDLLEPFVRALSVDGHLFAVPEEGNVAGVWYRRELLDDDGGRPPTTWNEFRRVADRARAYEQPVVFPAGTAAGETTTYWLTGLLASNGVEVMGNGSITLDRGATVETLRFLRTLVDAELASSRLVGLAWDHGPIDMVRGRSAITFGGSYEARVLAAGFKVPVDGLHERVVFAPFPAGPEGRPRVTLGGMVYVVFRQSGDPAAAAAFLQHIMGADRLGDRSRDQGTIPPRRSAIPAVARESAFVAETHDLLTSAALRPVTDHYHLVSNQLQTMVEAVLTGRLGVAAATERTAELISAITGLPIAR